jgi:hypothetical protein
LSEELQSEGRTLENNIVNSAVMGRVLDLHSEIEIPKLVGVAHEIDGEHDEAAGPGAGRNVTEE